MMRSNSFDTQEARETGLKEAGEPRGPPSSAWKQWKTSSRQKERNAKTKRHQRSKEENPCQSEEGAPAWDKQPCLDQRRRIRRGQRQRQETQEVRKESKRMSETTLSTWPSRAQRGSLQLCHAEPPVKKRKSETSGKQHRLKPTPREKSSKKSQERRKTRKESQRQSEGESAQTQDQA